MTAADVKAQMTNDFGPTHMVFYPVRATSQTGSVPVLLGYRQQDECGGQWQRTGELRRRNHQRDEWRDAIDCVRSGRRLLGVWLAQFLAMEGRRLAAKCDLRGADRQCDREWRAPAIQLHIHTAIRSRRLFQRYCGEISSEAPLVTERPGLLEARRLTGLLAVAERQA